MKPAAFEYRAVASVDEAVAALAAGAGEARLIAGGQSLVAAMNLRLARPSLLVDINRIPGLDRLDCDDPQGIRVGALVRHHALANSAALAGVSPLMVSAARSIAHDAIRRRGTVCGSLAHADPAAQWPLMACLFDAQLHTCSPRGARVLAAHSFFRGLYETALDADEMLVSAVFARPLPGERSALRWAWRRHGDFVIGAVGMRMQLTHDARIAQLQAWAGGFDVCPVPLAPALSDMLGERPDPRAFAPLAARACNFEPLSDLRASATYRRELLERLLNECFVQCVAEPT